MEKDVEQRLRDKYALIDKNDVDQLAEAQKNGLTLADEGLLVGDLDGQGFGVGNAPKDSRVGKNELLKVTKKNRSKAATKTSSPPLDQQKISVKQGVSSSKDSNDLKKDQPAMGQPSGQAKDPQRPS
jgi:hypothetical protein